MDEELRKQILIVSKAMTGIHMTGEYAWVQSPEGEKPPIPIFRFVTNTLSGYAGFDDEDGAFLLMAVMSNKPGSGMFKKLLDTLESNVRRVRLLAVSNDIMAVFLSKRGYLPERQGKYAWSYYEKENKR